MEPVYAQRRGLSKGNTAQFRALELCGAAMAILPEAARFRRERVLRFAHPRLRMTCFDMDAGAVFR